MRLFELHRDQKVNFDYNQVTEFDKVKEFIDSHCSKSLQAMQSNNRLLFRGIPSVPSKIFVGNSEKARPPRNTKLKYHKAIDKRLKQSGFKALRSNSIFVTSDHMEARNYGYLFVIFPFDNCDITWSSEYTDLTINLGLQSNRQPVKQVDREITSPTFSNDEFIKEYGFHKDNLIDAIKTRNEIYIHGSYVAVPFTKNTAKIIDTWVNRKHDNDNWFGGFHSHDHETNWHD